MVNDMAVMDRVFDALANPVRRDIVSRLAKGEMTAGEVAEPLPMSLPAVSRHLRVLEESGIIARRREGRTHWISAQPEPLAMAGQWLHAHSARWQQAFDRLQAQVEVAER